MKKLFGSTLVLTALVTLFPACEQPKPSCTAGVGAFAAKYTLKSGDESCVPGANGGEIIGLMKYNPSLRDDKTHQDFTKASLAIRTTKLGAVAVAAEDMESGASGADATGEPTSIGDFSSTTPDEDDVCTVPTLSAAEEQATDMAGTTTIKYEWSNVRLYVTTASPGTQMVGDLTYSETRPDNSTCSATYSVLGLWPAVSCEAKVDGKGTGMADPALCSPTADPAHGRATGSGINPDLEKRVACDPKLLLCVLTAPPDALK